VVTVRWGENRVTRGWCVHYTPRMSDGLDYDGLTANGLRA
jgi:hypothetical protein